MRKLLKLCSAVLWGVVAVVFGVGVALAGLQTMTGPAATLTVGVGVVVIAAAFGMHRLTCYGIGKLPTS